jgi:hypothetical protein
VTSDESDEMEGNISSAKPLIPKDIGSIHMEGDDWLQIPIVIAANDLSDSLWKSHTIDV